MDPLFPKTDDSIRKLVQHLSENKTKSLAEICESLPSGVLAEDPKCRQSLAVSPIVGELVVNGADIVAPDSIELHAIEPNVREPNAIDEGEPGIHQKEDAIRKFVRLYLRVESEDVYDLHTLDEMDEESWRSEQSLVEWVSDLFPCDHPLALSSSSVC